MGRLGTLLTGFRLSAYREYHDLCTHTCCYSKHNLLYLGLCTPLFYRVLMPLLLLIIALAMPTPASAKDGPVAISSADPSQRLVPRPEEFQIGPGDKISIKVWRHTDLDMDITIAPDGSVTYPLVGRIVVSGMTYPQLVAKLTTAISEFYTEPQVTVNILELKNQKVFVIGEVSTPSVLQLNNEMSILEALTIAGGINPAARTDNVLLIRGDLKEPKLYTVNVKAIYTQGDVAQMVYLQRGDIVMVPTRTITNVARYFKEVQGVLSPFVAGSAIYRNAASGGAQGTSSALE
jgi:polysaccharide export outer membrane protein